MIEEGKKAPTFTLGKKTKGVIRSSVWIDRDGVVRKHWKRVADAAKHPAQVWQVIQGASR